MAGLSTLGSGTRAIGVYEQRFAKPVGPLCVYLHGVGDPGNVGAVLRSALAFGASCVALGPGCADPHSPKAVRASMGAIFAVGLARVSDVGELPGNGSRWWRVRASRSGMCGAVPVAVVSSACEAVPSRERDQSVRDTLANANALRARGRHALWRATTGLAHTAGRRRA